MVKSEKWYIVKKMTTLGVDRKNERKKFNCDKFDNISRLKAKHKAEII